MGGREVTAPGRERELGLKREVVRAGFKELERCSPDRPIKDMVDVAPVDGLPYKEEETTERSEQVSGLGRNWARKRRDGPKGAQPAANFLDFFQCRNWKKVERIRREEKRGKRKDRRGFAKIR